MRTGLNDVYVVSDVTRLWWRFEPVSQRHRVLGDAGLPSLNGPFKLENAKFR